MSVLFWAHTHLEDGFFFLSLALPILLYAQYSLLCLHVGGKEENLPTSYSPLSFLSFFNGCIKAGREKNEEREEQQHTLSHMCAKGRKERKKGENMRRQLAAQFEGSCKSGRKRGKRTNVLARDAIQRKTRRFLGTFLSHLLSFPMHANAFSTFLFPLRQFPVAFTQVHIREKRKKKGKRKDHYVAVSVFSPSRPFKFSHREKFSSFLSHFLGKGRKRNGSDI